MSTIETDIVIVGAGPVGLMCGYLASLSGLSTVIVDLSSGPTEVGRADALNARTLQLLETVDLFSGLYPHGNKCNTSSVWADGRFISRQSSWWDELEGCFHKHFLMLGQSHLEKLLIEKLEVTGSRVKRESTVQDIQLIDEKCLTTLSTGEVLQSKFVIGADGSRSFVREHFKIPFQITRPKIIWAVIDGIIETDFPKVPDIIVFQSETSDVAWIPREKEIDRFYVRMDKKDFSLEESVSRINLAIKPHALHFKEIEWFSQFSVKESVAEKFQWNDRVFLVGDACHVHSVNGGQGLNTGLSDAFNLIWKLNHVLNQGAPSSLLQTYESERKPVAVSVIETSGELVRSTKYSDNGTHAENYVKIIQKRSGNITGMGIRYGSQGEIGSRLFDFEVFEGGREMRVYSLLDYTRFTLLIFGEAELDLNLTASIQVIRIYSGARETGYSTPSEYYKNQAILVRPDSYIESCVPLAEVESLLHHFN